MNQKQLDDISSFFQSFYAEFFGTFIPGFIAVVTVSSLCVIFAIYCGLIRQVSGVQDFLLRFVASDNSIKLISSWAVFGVVCAFSYAVGAIIYRRAPKVPDAIASYRQWKETVKEERKSLAVDFARLANNKKPRIGIAGWPFWKGEAIRSKFGSSIDYPYPHLRQYLAARGHIGLLKYVPWCGNFGMGHKLDKRSKTHINIIKQYLASTGNVSVSRDLVRNESHIRLLNSLWYSFRFLQELSISFFIIQVLAIVSNLFRVSVANNELLVSLSMANVGKRCSPIPLIVYASVFFFVWLMKRNIVKCFHYVRIRELVMILNAAETVRECSQGNKSLSFFSYMDKCNTQFIQAFCLGCPNEKLCGSPNNAMIQSKEEP